MIKNLPAEVGDASSVPGSERSPGGGNDNRSNILAWKIPWTGEPGRPQSKGSQSSDMTEPLSTNMFVCVCVCVCVCEMKYV